MFRDVHISKQNERSEAGGQLVPARLELSHELLVLRVAMQPAHAGIVARKRIVGHAGFSHAPEPGDRLVWFTHLGAGRGQNESRVMKMVVVLSEAGCNLDLALGLLRLGFRGIEKPPYHRALL